MSHPSSHSLHSPHSSPPSSSLPLTYTPHEKRVRFLFYTIAAFNCYNMPFVIFVFLTEELLQGRLGRVRSPTTGVARVAVVVGALSSSAMGVIICLTIMLQLHDTQYEVGSVVFVMLLVSSLVQSLSVVLFTVVWSFEYFITRRHISTSVHAVSIRTPRSIVQESENFSTYTIRECSATFFSTGRLWALSQSGGGSVGSAGGGFVTHV